MTRTIRFSAALSLVVFAGGLTVSAEQASAQAPPKSRKNLRFPVYRVSPDKPASTTGPGSRQAVDQTASVRRNDAPGLLPAPPTREISRPIGPQRPSTVSTPARAAVATGGVVQAGGAMPMQPKGSGPAVRPAAAAAPQHSLDPAINLARDGLTHIQQNVRDYTCTFVKRERVNGKLLDYEYMFTKIRNRKVVNGRTTVPFSVYMKFLKPTRIKGREVVFVEGRNNDKMMAHEGGTAGAWLPSLWLRPDSSLAMRGQLYPITELGIENLVFKLIERGQREKQYGECDVTFHKNAKVNNRVCTLLQVMHPEKRPHFEFYLAQVFIDDELNVPIRYAAYSWPEKAGGRPQVLEEYTYLDLKLNVGLTDADFDHNNPNYNFGRR